MPDQTSTRSVGSITDQRTAIPQNRSARQLNVLNRMRFAQVRTPQQVLARDPEKSYQFRLNPDQLKVSYKKIQQYILTKFGHERQYWGNQVWTFDYSGSSEVFTPQDRSQIDYSGRFDITQTAAWAKFRAFENFFLSVGEQNIEMSYWGYSHSFLGSMDNFSYTSDANKDPYRILYTFQFTAIPIIQPDVLLEYNPQADIPPSDLPQLDAGVPGPQDNVRAV